MVASEWNVGRVGKERCETGKLVDVRREAVALMTLTDSTLGREVDCVIPSVLRLDLNSGTITKPSDFARR